MYGQGSNYGRNHAPPVSPNAFYRFFRFAREDIPRLTRALRIPAVVRTPSACILDGEEALLMFLKVMCCSCGYGFSPLINLLTFRCLVCPQRLAYPAREVDLEHYFCRSIGFISEMVEAVRKHLDKIARKLVLEFDHRRIVPMIPVFAAAFRKKGCPLDHMWALLDGTFRNFCRPAKDWYKGAAQQVQFSGHKHHHGNNHQGLETPDGIVVEMHGPFEGRTNGQRMLNESGLLARIMQFCITATILFYLFGDRGYVHGHPALQVPFKGAGLTAQQKRYNLAMSRFRQPVEWSFGKISTLFAFVGGLLQEPEALLGARRVLLADRHSPHELPLVLLRKPDLAVLRGPNARGRRLPQERVLSAAEACCSVVAWVRGEGGAPKRPVSKAEGRRPNAESPLLNYCFY